MKFHEISTELEKIKCKKCYLCYPGNKYGFKVKPLFRDFTLTEAFVRMNLMEGI